MSKLVTADYAASLIKDGMTVGMGGFVGFGTPEELLIAIEKRYTETREPKDLTVFHGAGIGDGKDKGMNHMGHEGLIKRLICAHVGLAPKVGQLCVDNKIECFILPQGVCSHILRATAGRKPGLITHVGLKTYADPRKEACKGNDAARNCGHEVVQLVNIDGKDYMFYKSVPLDICFIRGTYADEAGNVSMVKEGLHGDQLEMAMATRNSGGIVVVQVEKMVQKGTLPVKDIKIPSFMVDYVVEGKPENHWQSFMGPDYRPELTGEIYIPMDAIEPMALNPRKICGRRGAMLLKKGAVVNLGIGVPEAIAAVAGEEGVSDQITLSIESGVLGGVPTGGVGIGGTVNPESIVKQPDTFDFYDGGGLDMAFLGSAEIDERGNVNVSKFGGRMVGPGGFINITQNAKVVGFCGTFTAGKMKCEIKDGKLNIIEDAPNIKFKKAVEQITYSGEYGVETGQTVYYITERALFKLVPGGMKLLEIAPGVDLQKDILDKMEFTPIMDDEIKVMDEKIFTDALMHLTIEE